MKKVLAVLLIAALALMMCSCGLEKVPTADEIVGNTSGNVYENDYLSLKFTKPSSWVFYTADEIAEITGMTEDLLAEGGVESAVDVQHFDMMAYNQETGSNISVALQIIGNTTEEIDLDEILDSAETEIVNTGAAIGMSYSFGGRETVKLSGIEFRKLTASAEFYGISYEQACYVAVHKGVAINVTVSIFDDTQLSEFEAMFS